ncbi:MAG: phenylalanine--tRNA ligase subunit beta [Candidatus Margulisbacteria bacterium]|nr:phenylalanine--tRNA ligase subunit beta [Candidatus Margulisiibacteriota bacterium]
MLISLNWLSEFCTFPNADALVNDLNRIGFEVESVEHKGTELASIMVGQIREIQPHPDADRLQITQVNIGSDTVQIVTAATNISVGDKVPVSLPGATLSGGLQIKKGKLRGVASNGMMCSAVECGLTDSSPGIWVLPPDTPVGVDFIDHAELHDTILDISILPNRGDALSYIGLARECHALYGQVPTPAAKGVVPHKPTPPITCTIDADFCRYYRAQKISGISNTHTPLTFQTRLYYTGFRPLHWIVDVTNIAMCETGQPMHAFDARNVSDISVTCANGGTIELLNEKTVDLQPGLPIIALNSTPSAIAGVMGGVNHCVTDTTTDIILETALFDAPTIRKAAKTCTVRSESSHRFEKNVDASGLTHCINRVLDLFGIGSDITVYAPIEVGNATVESTTINVNYDNINQFLGTNLPIDAIQSQLHPLGFICHPNHVEVPSWRALDCQEWPDIAEEIVRFTGLDIISPTPISDAIPLKKDPHHMRLNALEADAVSLGLTQVIPFPMCEKNTPEQPIIENAITPQLSQLRANALASLIGIAQTNAARHPQPCRLFSIGPVWDSECNESTHFSALIQGPLHYQPHLSEHQCPINFFDVKGMVEQLLKHNNTRIDRSTHEALHPGQSADIYVDDAKIGYFGMLHPRVQRAHKINPCGVIEFNVKALLLSPDMHYPMPSKFPATTRDVTYIMDASVSVADILAVLNENQPKECHAIVLSGYYQQKERSDINVTFRMTYQDHHGSLEMAAINDVHETFAGHVVDALPCRFP